MVSQSSECGSEDGGVEREGGSGRWKVVVNEVKFFGGSSECAKVQLPGACLQQDSPPHFRRAQPSEPSSSLSSLPDASLLL